MKSFFSFLILLMAIPGFAQETVDTLSIVFKQSKSVIDRDIFSNREHLDSMSSRLSDKAAHISSLEITGAASPEGPTAFNENLSRKRAVTLLDYLSSRNLVPDTTSFSFIGRNWEGLLSEVENDPGTPCREEVISLLRNIISSLDAGNPDSDKNLQLLKNLAGGKPYRYMYARMFPSIRTSALAIHYLPYRLSFADSIVPSIPTDISMIDFPDPILVGYGTTASCRPFYMDVKTNLLYDALLLPNIGVDFYVGKNLSIGANWMYAWWSKNVRHRFWRAYGGDLNLRWWFGRAAHEKPLTGHHLGLFAGVVTYDFELGGKGYMGGLPGEDLWHRCNFISGVEYGYSLPVSHRINIDFSLAVGYMGGRVIKYEPRENGYEWMSTKRLHWVGPTKAEISLVWLIGCDNYNRKKGGEK